MTAVREHPLSLATAPCNMIVRFVGGSREQVLQVSSACWEPR
jgi:hypothetical protein